MLTWEQYLARKEIEDACEAAGFPRGWFVEGDRLSVPPYVVKKFVPTVADHLLDAIFFHWRPQLPSSTQQDNP